MKIQVGDSIVRTGALLVVGIVERIERDQFTVRIPSQNNLREVFYRSQGIRPLAEHLAELRKAGTNFWQKLNLVGESTYADLVAAFGYATRQLRDESREKVLRQLLRAGLRVVSRTGGVGRDDRFRLELAEGSREVGPSLPISASRDLVPIVLPETSWPTALGLPVQREIMFFRALMESKPILCILHAPDNASTNSWLPPLWEGLTSWAYRGAQQFTRTDYDSPVVRIGTSALLQTYLKSSALDEQQHGLLDESRSLNLVTLRGGSDLPVDFDRLRAVFPGPVFQFDPEASGATVETGGKLSSDIQAVIACLFLAGGVPSAGEEDLCPLKTLLWSVESNAQILARATTRLGELFGKNTPSKFKGSNESSTALALKADVAAWIRRKHQESVLLFEDHQADDQDDPMIAAPVLRIDLFVENMGRVEIESLIGSGPIEAFYHQKVFSRVGRTDKPFWLVVPNDAVLWAGRYLADIAHHLAMGQVKGHVILPGVNETYLELQGRSLAAEQIGSAILLDELSRSPIIVPPRTGEAAIGLVDVAGYKEIREVVEETIIWPEKYRALFRPTSRSSGILFFGPPGCGKSRLARAIAGQLEQEVRLVSPSDLRGAYVGWGQIMIREQFDWVAENDRRMLIIDELDAVARSRRNHVDMHSDEKANVNELLVQLDRVGRLGRLVVGTTNFMDSLDDAVVRSGRFGRFIPVPPPNLEESLAILDYYLQRLALYEESGTKPMVRVPATGTCRSVLATHFDAKKADDRGLFCGADLEEAVNRVYSRCLRRTITGLGTSADYSTATVEITLDDISLALTEVPRSVTAEAFRQFIKDVKDRCPNDLADKLSRAFS